MNLSRGPILPAALAVLALALAMTAEAFLPGRVLLPLTPGDFPTWQAEDDSAGRLRPHPSPNFTMSDVLHLFVPGLATTHAAAERGQLPLWDPSQALGVPHIDQVHYGVFYPPTWIAVVLGLRGLAVIALVHLLVAGWGMLAYLRSIDRTPMACFVGAAAFAGSAWVTARLHAFPTVGALVWLPWVLWGLERGARHNRWAPRIAAAVALAFSFLAGFPQISLWVLVIATLLELVRAVMHRVEGEAVLKPLLASGLTLALGIGLALPQLLPTLEYMQTESNRSSTTAEDIATQGLEWPHLWHMLVPDRYATVDFAGYHPLAMRDIDQALIAVSGNRAETSMSVGAMGLLLALLTILYGRTWRMRFWIAVFGTTLVLLLVPGLLRTAADVFPVLRFGSPKRLLAFTSFALAVLAAGGLDLVRGRKLRVTVTAWIVAVVLTVVVALHHVDLPKYEESWDLDAWAAQLLELDLAPADATLETVFALVPREHFTMAADAARRSGYIALAIGIFAIVVFRPKREHSQSGWRTLAQRLPLLLAIGLSVELVAVSWPLLRAAPIPSVTTDASSPGPFLVPEVAKEARVLAAEGDAPPRVARLGAEPHWLRPNMASMFGLHDLQCYAPMAPRRVIELLRALDPDLYASGSAIAGFTHPGVLELPAVDLLGVRAVLTDREDTPSGFTEHARVGPVRILENHEALPRVFLTDMDAALLVIDPEERLDLLSRPDFGPRRSVLLETDELPQPPPSFWEDRRAEDARRSEAGEPAVDEGAPGGERQLELVAYEPGRVELALGPGEPALLVFTETWHAGWRAQVGGVAVPVWTADHAVMALAVWETDETSVVLRFEATLMGKAAWGAMGVGVIALLLLLWPQGREPKAKARPKAAPPSQPAPSEPASSEPASSEPASS